MSLISPTNGICIIPEGRVTKSCKVEGYPMEVTNIPLLQEILDYSKRNLLTVFYLTSSNGVSYADDIVKAPDMSVYRYDNLRRIKYSTIIAEEMSRKCIQFQTPKLYFMRRSVYDNLDLACDILKAKGVQVIQPIQGCSIEKAKSILKRGML